MAKVIEYKLVKVVDVNAYIQQGWQPIGGPSPGRIGSMFNAESVLVQAMVRYEAEATS